jgi:hypothetical protein
VVMLLAYDASVKVARQLCASISSSRLFVAPREIAASCLPVHFSPKRRFSPNRVLDAFMPKMLPYTQDVAGSNPAPPIPLRLEMPRSYEQIICMSSTSANAVLHL